MKLSGNRLSDMVQSLSSMLLFLLFALCSLIIIYIAADAYGRIGRDSDESFSSAAAARYITNKIRAANEVYVSENAFGSVLALSGDGYVTLIYNSQDGLKEAFAPEEAEADSDMGELLFPDVRFEASLNEAGIIEITAGDRKTAVRAVNAAVTP